MTFKNAILLAMSMTLVSGQRPSFAGSRPIGFPEIIKTTTEGLGNRFGEDDVSTTTVKLPLEANGDRDLVDRLSKLPVDQQPFWFINWQALEEHRKNPQTFEQKPNPFIENTAPVSNQQSSQQFTQQQFQQPQRPTNQQFQQPQRPNNQQFQQPQRPSTQQFQQPQRPSSQQFSQQQRPPQQQQQMSFEQQLQSMQQQQQALQQQQQSLQQQMQAFQQAQQQFSQERQKFMELQQAFMQQQNQQTGNSNTKNKPRSPNFD